MGGVRTLDVVPLAGAIGAEIRGVDLRRPLDDRQRDDIRDAVLRHLVVFFGDQPLTEDEQLAFATRFGQPCLTTPDPDEKGPVFAIFEDTADTPPNADHWHTDVSFSARPPDFAVLQMLDAPPTGGDTMWVSLYGAYESLSPVMQQAVAELEVDHGLAPAVGYLRRIRGEDYYRQLMSSFRPARHPLVRVHPETGRPALYLAGGFMDGIADAAPEESELLLRFLTSRLDDPNLQCRWRWRRHDVAMWDERCTNHRALSDHFPHHRMVRRCVVGGGVPTGP